MSNRLTFSLTSLILIFAFGIIAMPVMAAPPTFDSTAPATITLTIGETYEVLLPPATDPDGGVLTYTLEPKTASGDNADPGLLTIGFNFAPNTRLLTATADLPTGSLTGESGTYVYTASAAAVGAETDAETVTHEIAITVNSSVSFAGATISDMKWKVGRDIEVRLPQATDSRTGSAVAYSITTPPSGVSFNTSLRYLTGAPDTAAAEAEFTYTATGTANGNNAAAELKFKITVATDSDPVFGPEAVGDITGTVGMAITRVQLPTATDADGDEITHRLTPDLPAGLTFDSTLFLIEGTPTAMTVDADGMQAAVAYTWTATDADGPITGTTAASKTFNINIAAAPTPDPTPVAFASGASIDDQTYTTGMEITALELPAAMAGTGTGDLTYSLTPARPAGLSFDAETRMLSGTPTAAAVGATYTYKVTDSAATPTEAMLTFMITVSDPVAADPDIAQPTNVMAMAQNDGSVMVTWDWMGTDAEMTALDGFTVMWNPEAEVPATARSYTIPASDLTAGSETTVSVLARATADSGFATPAAPSAMSDPVTPVDPAVLRFEPDSIDDMTFTAGEAIGTTAMPYVQLPRAYGGTGLYTYSLLKGIGKVDVTDGDNGLSVDRTNLRLMGTPTAEAASTIYTWRVTDAQAHGDIEDSVELEFNITVGAAPIITPTNVAPVVTITTPQPPAGAIIFRPSFTIAYTATDENVGDTVTVEASHSVAPSNAAASYTVTHDATAKTVTVTQAQPAPVAVVTITVTGTDTGGLMGSDSIELSFGPRGGPAPPDTAPPVLTSHSFVVTNISQLTLTLVFNEPVNAETIDIDDHNGNGVSQAGPAAGTATNSYTVLVNAPGHATRAKTYMSLESGLADMLGNATTADQVLTYTTPTVPAPTVAISGPDALNCDIGDQITLTVTGTTETLVKGDITISAGWTMGDDSDPSDGTFDLVPDGNKAIGVTTVKVDVKANAVGANAAVSKTFTVGPVLTIPAGGYIVVIRPEHRFSTHLRDPLYLGSVGVRGLPVDIQYWECMPDLTVFFGRSGAGIGGGALVVKQSPDHTGAAIGKGSVGISEIMWASDEGTIHGLTSNTNQAREQWIELHNLNGHEVKVTLVARPTTYALTNEGAAEIDRMSNFEVGNSWVVKGQNGDSALGKDFVSMYRHKNNNNYAHGDNNGKNGGKWNASTLVYRTKQSVLAGRGATNPVHSFKGTPGRSNTISPAGPPVRTNVPNSPVVINEVANRRDQTLEWIELKNVSDGEVNLRNYHLSLVTGVNSERAFYTFPNNDNTKIPAKGLLLLVDTDPRYNDDHPVAVGRNIHTGNDQALGIGADAPRYMVTDFAEGGLPDNGEFVLMLRRPDGHDKAGTAENKRGTEKNMIDAVGYHPNLKSTGEPLYTNLWPLRVFGAPNDKNKIAGETVHYRQHAGRDPDEVPGNKVENAALRDADYTGVGYKRHTPGDAAHGGSPGYEHGTQKNLASEVSGTGLVTISEIMFDQGDGRYPQWIELYNSSPTQPVNLRGGKTGWKLVIENYDDGEIPINRLTGTLNFRNTGVGGVHTILPQQTVIVASTRARNSGSAFFDTAVVFPPTRVFSVWDDARGALDMKRSTDPILSTEGFYIELIDGGNDANPNGYVSDSVGNLTDSPNRRVAAEKAWELSDITGEMMDDMGRSSILRRYRKAEKGKDPRTWAKYTAAELMDLGIMAEGWVAAHKTDFREVRETWFGHPDDYGSPGITGGRVLPVSLSKFRPERLEDGTVAIRWLTESETNNAGFNILRSEERRGEFTKLNTQLIAGQGTTSERTNYEFADKSAKPNVVYYYQIQDVSLDGEVSILQITHLRGHVSAAGKATTTWGELKALQ
jgi:hypothetical protein